MSWKGVITVPTSNLHIINLYLENKTLSDLEENESALNTRTDSLR